MCLVGNQYVGGGGGEGEQRKEKSSGLFSNRIWGCYLADVKNMNSTVHKIKLKIEKKNMFL